MRGLGAGGDDHLAGQHPRALATLAEVEQHAIQAVNQLVEFLSARRTWGVGGERLVRRLVFAAGNRVKGHANLGQGIFEVIAFSGDAVDIHQAGAGQHRLVAHRGQR